MNIFHQLHHKQQGGHVLGAIILGFLGTLISSPCVTAPLVATLSYISQTGNEALGGSSLFVMGLGMGTPMVILGTLGGRFIPKAGKWTQLVNELFAILLFGLAIWIIKSLLPPAVSMTLWGLLALIAGYFMGFFNKRKYRYLPKVGMVIFGYGLILILGACLGQTNPLKPFEFLNGLKTKSHQANLKSAPSFITITTLDSLNAELEKHASKPILIKFYADWCASCKHMEVELFQDSEIVHALKNWVLIKADITENTLSQRELMKAYQVFAPPPAFICLTQKSQATLCNFTERLIKKNL
jgi:thiol:disulfide interchange protein DsbD